MCVKENKGMKQGYVIGNYRLCRLVYLVRNTNSAATNSSVGQELERLSGLILNVNSLSGRQQRACYNAIFMNCLCHSKKKVKIVSGINYSY
jgi:hypothetical protein